MKYSAMIEEIRRLEGEFPTLSVETLGRSLLGREIPILSFGYGRRAILYVGAHQGIGHITSAVLLAFAREFLSSGRDGSVSGVSRSYLEGRGRYFILPMLNPDGVSLSQKGLGGAGILSERLLRMNGGSSDFSKWQANARGVDLEHNYDAGFWEYKRLEGRLGIEGGGPLGYAGEYPLSEPESARLAALFACLSPSLVLSLQARGSGVLYTSLPRSAAVARAMARHAGNGLSVSEREAHGSLTDYASRLGIPSYTVACGRGADPLPDGCLPSLYAELRRLLWLAPIL